MSTKTHWLRRGLLLAATATGVGAAFAADGVWQWREGVGTGGTNWTAWTDTANWTGGVVAAGSTSVAKLTAATNTYIMLPSGTLQLNRFSGQSKGKPVLCGDGTLALGKTAGHFSYAYLYTDFSVNGGDAYHVGETIDVCGDLTAVSGTTFYWNNFSARFDRYAKQAGGVRVVDSGFQYLDLRTQGGDFKFYAPHGLASDAASAWSQTAGSAFLAPVVPVTHALPAGTIVTGEGIPADTFLKRIFPDGTIELSNAATTTAAENELTFAAMTSDLSVSLHRLANYNGYGTPRVLKVQKYREEDEIKLTTYYQGLTSKATGEGKKLKVTTDAGMYPGKVVLTKDAGVDFFLILDRARVEIAGDMAATDISVPSGSTCARLSVAEGKSYSVKKLSSVKQPLVKEGAGTLTIGVSDGVLADAAANVVVEEGTFAPVISGEYEELVIRDLTIKAGAVLQIFDGLHIQNLHVEKGAVVSGNAELKVDTIATGSMSDIVPKNGAVVVDPDPVGGDLKFELTSGEAEVGGTGEYSLLYVREGATFRVTGTNSFDVLLVGGGGGGGGYSGGGGGGGGFVYTQNVTVVEGLYGISAGAGGLGGIGDAAGSNGGDSSAFGVVAYGGGCGRLRSTGANGASGGGGGANYWASSKTGGMQMPGGSAIYGDQGFGGGFATNVYYSWQSTKGGGGGGAGGPGNDAATGKAGNGGIGRVCNITGTDVVYGGGGGGGAGGYSGTQGLGGAGGGGDGAYTTTYPAVSNAKPGKDGLGGGGGGGGSGGDKLGNGANGGSGIVIIRYKAKSPSKADAYARGLATSDAKVTHRKGYEVHTFTADGAFALAQDAVVDMLLVGGGGGAGGYAGGGGGGGGVLVYSNLYLVAGNYQIGVGAGGLGGAGGDGAASNGKDTTFYQVGSTATNFVALGGGAGGNRNDGTAKTGASGGGAGTGYLAHKTSMRLGAAGTPGQGYGGGASTNMYYNNWVGGGGGGGGAGGPGHNGAGLPDDDKLNSVGGTGLYVDFAGAGLCYGGGGSGGSIQYQYVESNYYVKAAPGGGGRGAGIKSPYGKGAWRGEDGTAGTGGGGGGGGGNGDQCGGGGSGGSGTVIIRYRVQPAGMTLLVK